DTIGWIWSLLKIAAVAFVVIWARVAYPRLREDQLNAFAWKVLVPIALAQLALTTVVAVMIA
ncbi:NADH-quinone oxidoreductase subunit H, partial [Aeromicrobium sp.]